MPIGRRGRPSVRSSHFPVHDATTATRRAGSLTPIDAVSERSDRPALIGLLRIKLFTKLRSTPAKRHARTYIEIMAKPPVVRHRTRKTICREGKLSYLSCVYSPTAGESRHLSFAACVDPASLETYSILITNQVALLERPQQGQISGVGNCLSPDSAQQWTERETIAVHVQ